MSESRELSLQLLRQMNQTVERLLLLSEEDLGKAVDHVCAMNGGLRRLLVHNAEHERIHAGAISNARFTAKRMQESDFAHLALELMRSRIEVVGQLLFMEDALLDAKPQNDEWPIRKHIEHLLYWEKDSMDAMVRDLKPERGAKRDTPGASGTAARRGPAAKPRASGRPQSKG